jgi:subtilisin family serine protease
VRRGEISRARDGRLEYITSGPVAESGDAAAALNALGAQITRLRDYPALERRALVAVFPRGLSLEEARDAVSAAAPATEIDVHALYGFAQGRPRLYAPELIGDGAPGVCRLRRAVPVGVIDGPVDGAHPALRGATVSAETVLEAGTRRPDARHGTAVAALIAGEDPGGALAGFARGVSVHAVDAFRIHRGNPRADVEHVAAALDVLAARGVRLVNMSFAGPPNRALGDILRRADARGLVMIAAAGNAGSSRAAYPAAAPEVIAVTAVDARGRRYREANTGAHIEFAAPGVDLYTAGGGSGGSYASGTSYAAPIVTALAARLAARERISPETLRAALRARALDLGADGRDAEFGWGLVRAGGC